MKDGHTEAIAKVKICEFVFTLRIVVCPQQVRLGYKSDLRDMAFPRSRESQKHASDRSSD